jgi:hypothetical protein
MRGRRFGTPIGTGQFAGREDPQAADEAVAGDLLGSMIGDGAIRVALTTASNRRFTAGDLSPQVFLMPPSYPNDPTSLADAPRVGVGNYRRMLNRHRGISAT